MDRPDITIIPADTAWLHDVGAQAVCHAVSAGGANIYFVGGCVRDAILGLQGSDIDMATTATPQEVTRLAQGAGLKVVPTGIDHGTVTVVAHGIGYEITTFRQDVRTHGRHADVAFSDDISQDARRRDFTLNALYATPEGVIVDPLGGLADCLARRIRFIENANARIREDYLRALRFFRFHAWYADPDLGFDAEALDAIAQNADGIETLSAERIGTEMCKLLSAPDPAPAIATMQQTGVLQRVLPGSDIALLGPVVHLHAALEYPPDWRLRLAALGGEAVKDRLRLNSKDARILDQLRDNLSNMTPIIEVAYRQGEHLGICTLVMRAALANQSVGKSDLDPIRGAAKARFPIKAQDLMPGLSGKALGDRLNLLERRWIASGFALSREELMTAD